MAFTTDNFTQDQIDELVYNLSYMLPVKHIKATAYGGDGSSNDDLHSFGFIFKFNIALPEYIRVSGPNGFNEILYKQNEYSYSQNYNGIYISSYQYGPESNRQISFQISVPPGPVESEPPLGHIDGEQSWWVIPGGPMMTIDNTISILHNSYINVGGYSSQTQSADVVLEIG